MIIVMVNLSVSILLHWVDRREGVMGIRLRGRNVNWRTSVGSVAIVFVSKGGCRRIGRTKRRSSQWGTASNVA